LFEPEPVGGGGGLNLSNVGATLVTSGGVSAHVMNNSYWDTDDGYLSGGTADVLKAITTAMTVFYWINQPGYSPNFSRHWSIGDDIRMRQGGSLEARVNGDLDDPSVDFETPNVINVGSWSALAMVWDGSHLKCIRFPSGSADTIRNEDSGETGYSIGWSPSSEYTIGDRPQAIVPPIWFDSVLSETDLNAIVASASGSSYEATVLSYNPIHFVNEADGLTDTLGV
jgi:hypothetical protein